MIAGAIHGVGQSGKPGVFSHLLVVPASGITHYQATNAPAGRYDCVTSAFPETAQEANDPTYRVEAPRASDAIGCSLRHAFINDNGVPADMAALLLQLNRTEFPRPL